MSDPTHELVDRVERVMTHLGPVIADMQTTLLTASGGDPLVAYLACERVICAAAGAGAACRAQFEAKMENEHEAAARVLDKVAASLRGKREGL